MLAAPQQLRLPHRLRAGLLHPLDDAERVEGLVEGRAPRWGLAAEGLAEGALAKEEGVLVHNRHFVGTSVGGGAFTTAGISWPSPSVVLALEKPSSGR